MQRMKKRRPMKHNDVSRVMVNLNAGQVQAVRAQARRNGHTMSAWVRVLVLAELANPVVMK
jgi:hypothetical protein